MEQKYTKSEPFGVEQQEPQQNDGTDGPSKFTDPEVSSATGIGFG